MASYEEVMKRLASKSKTAWRPIDTALEAGGRARTHEEMAKIDPDDKDREAKAKKDEIIKQIAETKKRLQALEKQYREVR